MLGLVLKQGLGLTIADIGLIAAIRASGFVTFIVVLDCLVVAMLERAVRAYRAVSLDPNRALRYEAMQTDAERAKGG